MSMSARSLTVIFAWSAVAIVSGARVCVRLREGPDPDGSRRQPLFGCRAFGQTRLRDLEIEHLRDVRPCDAPEPGAAPDRVLTRELALPVRGRAQRDPHRPARNHMSRLRAIPGGKNRRLARHLARVYFDGAGSSRSTSSLMSGSNVGRTVGSSSMTVTVMPRDASASAISRPM